MTVTMTGHNLPDADRREALRSLARTWNQPCPQCGNTSCEGTEGRNRRTLRRYISAALPTECTRQRQCGCLDCLWDAYLGDLALLEGLIAGLHAWWDVDPAYESDPDPEWAAQFEMEMRVSGLLRDLMHGAGARR